MKNTYLLSRKAGSAFLMACLSVVVLLSSCIKEPKPEPTGEANVKFINAAKASSAQDLYVNGMKKSTVPLLYGSASSYFTITSGSNQFVFANEGATTANAGASLIVPIGAKFHFILFRERSTPAAEGNFTVKASPVDSSAPAANKAKVRFMHFNSYYNNAFSISVVGGSPLTAALGFSNETPYYQVDPGAKLSLTATGITTADIDPGFEAGKIYTVWFGGNTNAELEANVVLEN